MSNPFMRDALVDEMEQGVKRPGGGNRGTSDPVSAPYRRDTSNMRFPGPNESRSYLGGNPNWQQREREMRASFEGRQPPAPGAPGTVYEPSTGAATSPWDAPESSQYAPRIVTRGGQSYLTEHGNERLLQPDEIADATAYRDDFWRQFPTGFQPGVGPQRNEDYAPPSQTGAGGTGNSGLGASGATAGRYSGFDTQRAQDPSTSAKDAFLAAATASGSMPSTKEEAEAWFNQYVKQALIDAGYQVDQVVGDKAFVRTRENPGGEWIDFLIDAGGSNPMIGWQSEVTDPSIGGEMGGAPAGAGGGTSMDEYLLGDDSATDDIDAAIQKLLESGMSFEEILAMLSAQGVN